MHVFMTGASGWIGSATAAELLAHGHTVTGLSRSTASAATLTAAGVTPHPGDLRDLDSLRAGATESDAVVHLGNIHDFTDWAESGRVERVAVETLGESLVGSRKPFLIASGIAGYPGVVTEDVPSPHQGPQSLRGGSENLALEYADRDVRSGALRFAPTVHGPGDHGFVATLVQIARDRGFSAYVGAGTNAWAAVHRLDAATLVRLALENAPAGAIVHAVAEEGVSTRAIAEAIGAGLGLPVRSLDPADADAHFGWMGRFFAHDVRASSAGTRAAYGWQPTHPTLLADLAGPAYFSG